MTQKSDSDRERAEELAYEVFSKCFLVLLAHVQRRIARDPNYEEPRFLAAFLVAFENVSDPKIREGERVIGLATSEDNTEAYTVMLQKRGRGAEIIELRDKVVGQREMMRLMQLSILLDNLPGNKVRWVRAIEILDSSIPWVKFLKFPNTQWKRYRDKLIQEIWQGKIPQLSPTDYDAQKLRAANSFSEVPQALRITMGTIYAHERYPQGNAISITTPGIVVDKQRVFEMAKDVLYGGQGEFMNKDMSAKGH